jgi:hypothetical protein
MNSQQPPYQPYPPYAPPPPGAPMPWPGMQAPRKSGMARASFILSLIGLVPCTFGVLSLIGTILGAMSAGRISKSQGMQSGMGRAVAGLALGVLGILANAGFWYFTVTTVNSVDPVAEKYLRLASEGNYDEAYAMTSPDFQKKTSPEEFRRYIDAIRDQFGDYKSKKVTAAGGMSAQYRDGILTVTFGYSVDYSRQKGVMRMLTFIKIGEKWFIEGDQLASVENRHRAKP